MSKPDDNDKDDTDLVKINELINRLDVCTSLPEQHLNASEINAILASMNDHLINLKDGKRLASNEDIIQQRLSGSFNLFCQILTQFSLSLHNYPLFLNVLINMWNLICSKLGESIEKELLSAKELYMTAINVLNMDQISKYFSGYDVENMFKTYAKVSLKLAHIVINFDARRTEHLNLTDYLSYQCMHEKKYDIVFHQMISFIDYCFNQTELNTDQKDCIDRIFSLIVTMSDSKSFLFTTIRIGFAAKLVQWLDLIDKKTISFDPLLDIILSITNISQCEEGIIALNEANAVPVLQTSEKALAERFQKSPSILTYYPRIYAMLVTTEQLKNLTVLEPAIDRLLQKIHQANASKNLRSPTGHLYEYVVCLAKLLVNDNMAKYLLNNVQLGGLTFFVELFHKHNVVTMNDLFVKHLIRLALYNILCSLSFHQTVQQELKENQRFIKTVMEASHSSISANEAFIPSSLRNNLMTVKTAADGILIYLDQFKVSTSDNNNNNNGISKSTTKIPMISYSHKDAQFCRSVVNALKKHSISVWIDEDGHCLSDDCWEEIALAIKNASMVLIVVSDNYCTTSDSCRVEATYAIKLKIPIIALYIDDKYQAEPWLDIHLTGLHVKFGQKSFDERITRLAKYITARNNTTGTLPTVHPSHEVNLVPVEKPNSAVVESKKPEDATEHSVAKTSPRTWSAAEVRSWWYTEKNLVPQLCNFCDGEALFVYAQVFIRFYQEDPLKHFQTLQTRLKQQHNIDFCDDQYSNVVSSMLWIVKQDKKPEQTVSHLQHSAACTLL